MRITQNSINRRYLTNVNKNLSDYSASSNKLHTGRAFTRMSENVTKGTRALGIRAKLYRNEQLQDNAKTINEQFRVAEDNLTSVKDVLQTINGKLVSALNGTNSQQELNIYASEFDTLRESIIQFSNCTYDDKYIFGGTNNAGQPYTLDESGELLYNGTPIDEITEKDGEFFCADGTKVPHSGSVLLDVGLDMRFSNGQVDKRTVIDSTVSGLKSMGCGTTALTYQKDGKDVQTDASNNVYALVGQVCDALRENDMDKLGALSEHLKTCTQNAVGQISDIGVRSKFLDNNLSRLETEALSLTEMKENVEGIADTDEIINYQAYKYAYSLTIQMGNSLVPKSLMDYINP